MYLLLTIVFAALGVSFLCSILEAALLSAPLSGLLARRSKSKGIALLLELKQHRMDDAISAILTLNTISHTVGAALAGAQAAALWGSQWVAYFSVLLTALIFIFSEIIPKTLGTVHAVTLASPVGRATYGLMLLMSPILVITRLFTKLFSRNKKIRVTRGEITAMAAFAARQGSITNEQSRALSNLLHYDRLSVADVMTPRPVLAMMSMNATVAQIIAKEDIQAFSRIPIFGENHDDVKGYVLMREIWAWAARDGNPNRNLATFSRPLSVLPKRYSVGDALRVLTEKSEHIALILDEYGGVSGLVTLEDLIETILGIEIIDESDRVIDLRSAALKIRDQRLARIDQRRLRQERAPVRDNATENTGD